MNNIETEKKFLIRFPDEKLLLSQPNYKLSDIEQIYLADCESGFSERIRMRKTNGICKYYHTQKKHITAMSRIENERLITAAEYGELKLRADRSLSIIRKKRYCIPYMGHVLEIDIFPFWKNQAYLEIELNSENEEYQIPSYLEIIRDVTLDRTYTNRALAQSIPNED